MNEYQFSHQRSSYERPNFPYRCGRGALWLKPCHQGPHIDGTCGGTTECSPALIGDHWECRRPAIGGGPCEEGPTPTGQCAHRHPPCVPTPTFRVYRGRLAILAVGLVAALLCISWVLDQLESSHLSVSPGPISSSHIKFTEKRGCSICHESHNLKTAAWLRAVLQPLDISSKCGDCHTFGGPGNIAHNGDSKKHPRLQPTNCLMCHREHKGAHLITEDFNGQKCNFCHRTPFESFSRGHPEFPANYPHTRRNSIKFDHVSHLKKYFADPKYSANAPSTCMGCHKVTQEERIVPPDKFDVVCAKCHAAQILKKDLVLVRLPELDVNRIDPGKVREACHIPKDRPEGNAEDEEFVSISTETVSLVSAYLLNVPEDEPEVYGKNLQELILAMVEKSTAPLAELIDRHSPVPVAEKMLAGLNPEVIKRAACAWGLNVEYEPPAQANFGGWNADLLEIRYTPVGHKDPVAKSWIDFALTIASNEKDSEKSERALALRDQMLSPKEGVGGCIKCHAVTAEKTKEGKEFLTVHWGYMGPRNRPYSKYSHKNHLDILGKGNTCMNCHLLNKDADYLSSFDAFAPAHFVTNFSPIERSTCLECHTEEKVKQNCQLCHVYHFKPGFKKDMLLAKHPS